MKFLLSNDDGYHAPGLACLRAQLKTQGTVTVVAPNRNRSGASHSLTLDEPLRIDAQADGGYCVSGTPADCVHLALTGLVEQEPDMVVSGINAGANLGDDVLYSGTVAAAMEGRFLGLPSVAVSLASMRPTHFDTAARVTLDVIERVGAGDLGAGMVLNLNVPDVPYEALKGIVATRLGHRHRAEPIVRDTDPRGRPLFWVGEVGAARDDGPGTDFAAVREGFASLTPLQPDLTRHELIHDLNTLVAHAQTVKRA